MAIPETTLQAWSSLGAVGQAQNTYTSIKKALEKFDKWGNSKYSFSSIAKIYLQGSYKNDTIVRNNGDVDIVIELTKSFHKDISRLTSYEQQLYSEYYSPAEYTWSQFRADVLSALKSYYGPLSVKEGNKTLKVLGDGTHRLNADVVVAMTHRTYNRFLGQPEPQHIVEGMTFYVPLEKRWVVNYPKIHWEKGNEKSTYTQQMFRPSIRVVKNITHRMVDQGYISRDKVCGFFLESLMFNVPDQVYTLPNKSLNTTIYGTIIYLDSADLTKFHSQHQQDLLFGTTREQWDLVHGIQYIEAFKKFWYDYA